jgi:hypothetical protein
MMRRTVPVLGLAALLAALAASPALAATQANTYAVKAKATPSAVKFAYTVGERSGLQPSAVKRYTIGFAGLRPNDRHLRKGALVGTGKINSYVYLSNDPSGAGGFPCAKDLSIYTAGHNKATLSFTGSAAACGGVGDLPPVPAKFVAFKGHGSALTFELPVNILHPISGLTVAVRSVTSSLKGSYLTGPKMAKRPVSVTFLTEAGQSTTVRATA